MAPSPPKKSPIFNGWIIRLRRQEVCYLRRVPESARGRPAAATEWRAAAYRHLWSALSLAHATEALLHELNLGLESATAFRWQIETARGHADASIALRTLPLWG